MCKLAISKKNFLVLLDGHAPAPSQVLKNQTIRVYLWMTPLLNKLKK